MKTEHFRKKLEVEKVRLESAMGNLGHRNLSVPNDWEPAPLDIQTESDIVDQAGVVVDRENDVAVLNALESRYDDILSALERIKKNKYGKCAVCGKEVSEARLEADAAATTCIEHLV